jgi:hypothetical protein
MKERAEPEVTMTATARMAPKISEASATCPHSEPPWRSTSPMSATARRKMPLAIRVKLWKTTSRETWISIDHRRFRTAASATSGAARMTAGARASSRAKETPWNSTASAYSTRS